MVTVGTHIPDVFRTRSPSRCRSRPYGTWALAQLCGTARTIALSPCWGFVREGPLRALVPSQGGTYGANAVACAAAAATIDVINGEGLVGNAAQRGAQLMAGKVVGEV